MKTRLFLILSFFTLSLCSCEKQAKFQSPVQFGILDQMSDSKCDGKPPRVVEVIDGFRKCSFFEFDKIKPIDTPQFITTDSVKNVPDDWEVVVVFDGVWAKSYLLSEMDTRELVNDYFGDVPVAVIY